jgi:splicing factor 3A subunit 3
VQLVSKKFLEQGRIWPDPPSAGRKSYAKQTVYDAHLTSKKHIKAAERLDGQDGTEKQETNAVSSTQFANPQHTSRSYKSALLTRLTETILFLPPIPSLIDDTQQNIERRSALTAREREQELEERVDEVPPDVGPNETPEEAEERIYNPLKLPLGWDGKPIPYWLYKLHGLGVEYKCEICSDFVYMGRKAFDRHFQESRHAFGMRALGLPNTKHFHEITKIQDALACK